MGHLCAYALPYAHADVQRHACLQPNLLPRVQAPRSYIHRLEPNMPEALPTRPQASLLTRPSNSWPARSGGKEGVGRDSPLGGWGSLGDRSLALKRWKERGTSTRPSQPGAPAGAHPKQSGPGGEFSPEKDFRRVASGGRQPAALRTLPQGCRIGTSRAGERCGSVSRRTALTHYGQVVLQGHFLAMCSIPGIKNKLKNNLK